MAKSLLASGFTKGSEIPICMANCPEFVMLLRAASLIGAKVNVFGAIRQLFFALLYQI